MIVRLMSSEWLLIVTSLVCLVISCVLLFMRILDVRRVRIEGINGAVRFMAFDNMRRQVFMVLWAIMLVIAAFDVLPWRFILDGLAIGGVLDGVLTYRRWKRMAELVPREPGWPGGRRKTDPKPERDTWRGPRRIG